MKALFISGACIALAAALTGAAPAATNLPLNSPTVLDGVEAVCTGLGEDAQHDARWSSYPLKIILAGKGGQYVADADVTLSQGEKAVVSVHCGGPWILLKVPAGRYHITGVLDGQSADTSAIAPATGQGQAILRFPNAGGAISPENKPKT